METKKRFTLLFLFYCCFGVAQDVHFSQFQENALYLSPALTGVYKEDLRFTAFYRRQWKAVPVPYLSFSGSGDAKVLLKNIRSGYLGLGGRFIYDKSGDAEMSLGQLGFSVAWVQKLTARQFVSAGIELAGYQRGFVPDKLNFGDQFNGDVFDPDKNTAELFPDQQKYYADFSAGLNWHFRHNEKRHLANLGFGAFHLNRPNVGFSGTESVKLPVRWSAFGLLELQLTPKMDLLFSGSGQFQGPDFESVFTTQVRYFLKAPGWNQIALQAGTAYRIGDAVIPVIGLLYGVWYAGFSYDITLSDLQLANQSNGGPEMVLVYKLTTKVKPVNVHKACPVF